MVACVERVVPGDLEVIVPAPREQDVDRPAPQHPIGEVHVPARRVLGLGPFHRADGRPVNPSNR